MGLGAAAGEAIRVSLPWNAPEDAAATPLRDNGFKVPLARNLVVRTLLQVTEGSR